MTRLTINIPLEVQDQVRDQVAFIAQRSPENGVRWGLRLRAAILRIGDLPGHTPDRTATRRRGRDTCKFVFERTYLIFYEVDTSQKVGTLINFRHGARRRRAGEP